MTSATRWTVCIATCFALSGCTANDLMLKRQAEAEAKIEHLLQADKKNAQRVNELAGQIQALDERDKGSAAQLKQLQESISELRLAQEQFALRTAPSATPKIEVINREPLPLGKDGGPPAEYVKAFGLYSANNFSAAIEAFDAFLKSTPKNDYAANAFYWIGECHYNLSDLPKALSAFQKVVDNYPKSFKTPDALLKLGYTQAAMKEQDKAQATFERLIRTYPSSPAAAKARERLTAN